MDFSWSPEQAELFERTIRAVNQSIMPSVARRGVDEPFPVQDLRACGEIGLLGLCLAPKYGGGGHDLLSSARAVEAFGYACEDLGLVFASAAHLFACAVPVAKYGRTALRDEVLGGLATGTLIGANAITEEGSGSDAFSLSCRARREGGSYILDGQKSFVTNGPIADLVIVYARTDPSAGFLGISAFAVRSSTPGIRRGPRIERLGLRSISVSTLELKSCRVSEDCLLGEEGQGAAIFQHAMRWERAGLFACWLGAMERDLERCVEHARARRQFGQRISGFQAVSHRCANMKLRLEGARLLLYRACWSLERDGSGDLETALAKLAVSEAAVSSSLDAIRIFGGSGFMSGTIDRGLRDAVGSIIASGTSDLLREIVARELGL